MENSLTCTQQPSVRWTLFVPCIWPRWPSFHSACLAPPPYTVHYIMATMRTHSSQTLSSSCRPVMVRPLGLSRPAPCRPSQCNTALAASLLQGAEQHHHLAWAHSTQTRGRAGVVRAASEVQESSGLAEIGKQDAESRHFALQCAQVADETRCQDIVVLHVAPVASWTSYMVFCSVFNRPQLLAAMARIQRMVTDDFPDRERKNQPGSSPWECLDYGDVVVHLMTAQQREHYDIEGFWAAAEEVELPWNTPGAVPPPGCSSAGPARTSWTKQY